MLESIRVALHPFAGSSEVPPLPPGVRSRRSANFHPWLAEQPRGVQDVWLQFYARFPFEFLSDCIKIVDKSANLVPLDIRNKSYTKAQTYFAHKFLRSWAATEMFFGVVLKARQWGCTTLVQALLLWIAIFRPYSRILVVADDAEGSRGILEMLRQMVRELPTWLRPKRRHDASNVVWFEGYECEKGRPEAEKRRNESWIRVDTANNAKAGRKWSLKAFHGSEVAFWGEDAKKVLLGVRQAVSMQPGSFFILESTANGWGGQFYDECQRAANGESGHDFIFIPWFWIDEYQLRDGSKEYVQLRGSIPGGSMQGMQDLLDAKNYPAAGLTDKEKNLVEKHGVIAPKLLWRRWAIKCKAGGDEELFDQEYPGEPKDAFVAAGSASFAPWALQYQREHYVRKPDFVGECRMADGTLDPMWDDVPGGRVRLWAKPAPGHEYILGIDPAAGAETWIDKNREEDDNATIQVFDRTAREQVGELAGRIPPDETATVAIALAFWFNRAVVVVENNGGWGSTILMRFQELSYESLYCRKVEGSSTNQETHQLGFNTNAQSRVAMVSTARACVRTLNFKIRSIDLVNEFAGMINKKLPSGGVRPEAKSGMKDDRATNMCMILHVDRGMGELQPAEEMKESLIRVPEGHKDYSLWAEILGEQKAEFSAW